MRFKYKKRARYSISAMSGSASSVWLFLCNCFLCVTLFDIHQKLVFTHRAVYRKSHRNSVFAYFCPGFIVADRAKYPLIFFHAILHKRFKSIDTAGGASRLFLSMFIFRAIRSRLPFGLTLCRAHFSCFYYILSKIEHCRGITFKGKAAGCPAALFTFPPAS